MIVKKSILVLAVIFIFFNVYSENLTNKVFMNFVNSPNEENCRKALASLEEDGFSMDHLSSEFFSKFRVLIENSDKNAFQLLKKISLKSDSLYFYVVLSVRRMMVKDFDFFVANIGDIDADQIKKLFVDDFLDMDESLTSYEFYSFILKKVKNVKREDLIENAKKIKKIVNDIMSDEIFMRNVKLRKEGRAFDIKFCQKYEKGANDLINFISENESVVENRFHRNKAMLRCVNLANRVNNVSDYDELYSSYNPGGLYQDMKGGIGFNYGSRVYHDYMIVSLSKKSKSLKGATKKHIDVVIRDLNSMVLHPYPRSGYGRYSKHPLFLNSFFDNNQSFLKKYIENYMHVSEWVAQDIAIIIKCCKKEIEYKKFIEHIKKLPESENKKHFRKLLEKIDYHLKTGIYQGCNALCLQKK